VHDLIPRVTSVEQYRAIYADARTWQPAMRAIAARHRLSGAPDRQMLGTHVVFAFGGRIVKLFCPLWLHDYDAEKVTLQHVRGLPTPEIVAEGMLDGWPYLVLSRVEGVPAVTVWPRLSPPERARVVRQSGAFLRALHDHPLPEGLPADWDAFLQARLAQADGHHDAPEPWRSWIRDQLAGFREPPLAPVLLNGDLTDDHVLLARRGDAWHLEGVIDFGDARVGHPYYDLIAPLACFAFGQPALARALVEGYGMAPTPDVRDTLTRFCLLHEFGRLGDFLARYPVSRPEAFAAALWGEPASTAG
jgi:hygromycin-B 7''-O-kinase